MSDFKNSDELARPVSGSSIPEDQSRLFILKCDNKDNKSNIIAEALRKDKVVLVQNLHQEEVDGLMYSVAEEFNLCGSLELQAALASSLGHRENIGKYYMTVNKRYDYQFVSPHSEGSSFTNLQLASFFCDENTTDGGETILLSINPDCNIWGELREQVRRGRSSRPMAPAEIGQARALFRLNMPEDAIREDDEILVKKDINEVFSLFDVLARTRKTYSKILDMQCHAYWDSIESIDLDSLKEFSQFLRDNKLLKLPNSHIDDNKLDDSNDRRIRGFGSQYGKLFRCKITRKLAAGDCVIVNNVTWCHSVSNWTPGSGVRKVAAAFA
jgi:hypothetical protein